MANFPLLEAGNFGSFGIGNLATHYERFLDNFRCDFLPGPDHRVSHLHHGHSTHVSTFRVGLLPELHEVIKLLSESCFERLIPGSIRGLDNTSASTRNDSHINLGVFQGQLDGRSGVASISISYVEKVKERCKGIVHSDIIFSDFLH